MPGELIRPTIINENVHYKKWNTLRKAWLINKSANEMKYANVYFNAFWFQFIMTFTVRSRNALNNSLADLEQ